MARRNLSIIGLIPFFPLQVVPFTTSVHHRYPSEAYVAVRGKKNKAMADPLTTVNKLRLINRLHRLSTSDRTGVEQAIKVQLGLNP